MGDDFILEFQYEAENEWKIFMRSILFHLVSVLGFTYFFLTKEELGLYLGFGFLIITVPQIILHIQYRISDKNKKITVNHSKKTVKVERNEKFEVEFQFKDISKILRHKGQKDENNVTYALPTFFYNYTEIILKNGQKVYFTDFMTKTLGLKNIDPDEKLSPFNLIVK